MDLKKYIYSHCVHPVPVKVWDAYSQSFVVRDLPCGKCLHCRNSRVNDWVTRLYAQAKYSKYVYYITLDYAPFDLSSSAAQKLAVETAATYHNINCNHKYGLHPLLLVKNHLQDFLKRFRKNTGIKIQYFACGEYGTHANGKGFARPHFHIIVFSNDAITPKQFEDAWTINGYKIGRVDFNDLYANGSLDSLSGVKTPNKDNKYSSKFVFKYVCKYLQKDSFNFEDLATIEFHRSYFKSLCSSIKDADSLFPSEVPITDAGQINELWNQYVKNYSPFIVCSKRPSIGLQYFKENCERFTQKDFRLFGLPEECSTFPSYYIRKTKEQYCDFTAVGEKSYQPTTSSRVGNILQILSSIYQSRTDINLLGKVPEKIWYQSETEKSLLCRSVDDVCSIPFVNLHMYNRKYSVFYQFNGYGYNLWKKFNKIGYVKVGYMDIIDVINQVQPSFDRYYEDYIKPMHMLRILSENDLQDSITSNYGDNMDALFKFKQEVYARYNAELQTIYKTKLLTQNSKLSF